MIICIKKLTKCFLVVVIVLEIICILKMRIINIKPILQVLPALKGNGLIGFQFTKTFPVDLVYTWVNGSDPKHHDDIEIMMKELKKLNLLTASNLGNLGHNRFADHGGLRYSLRSVEKYANWIRHVYIVTNGQIPHWLDLTNPRVTIVRHEELFDDLEYLPTFSSPAIEHNLYKIKGLSEQFIYMNDDIMFGQNITIEDFYTEEKGTKIYLDSEISTKCSNHCMIEMIKNDICDHVCNHDHCAWDGGDCRIIPENTIIPLDDDIKAQSDFMTSHFYSSAMFNRFFGFSNRSYIMHAPLFIDKQVNKDMVNTFSSEVKETSKHRIRNPEDLQFGFSYMYYLIETQNRYEVIKHSTDVAFVMLTVDTNKTVNALTTLLKGYRKFICLNDDINYDKVEEASKTITLMHNFFESMFPERSSFEVEH